jgi:hypothetical protein
MSLFGVGSGPLAPGGARDHPPRSEARGYAALRWLSRENPDIGNARDALGRVLTAGHRARDIVANVCAMFKKDTQEKISTDVNQLSRTVLTLGRSEELISHVIASCSAYGGSMK